MPVLVFNGLPLLDFHIKDVLTFIKSQSSGVTVSSEPVAVQTEPASEEDIKTGQDLFQGNIRFSNGGPTCNSCHDVKHDAVIGGGILAVELTDVFSRMGSAGVKAILGQSPYPVMDAAYKNKVLTENEITSLVSFLQDADSQQFYSQPRDYGVGLFISGLVGTGILFGLCSLIWRGRKSGPVNRTIFERQTKSTWED